MWYNNIIESVGQTPLVQLNSVNAGLKPTMLAKVEYFNPGNSIKDRIAIKMLEDAEAKGLIKPGGTIVEGTSGNTGMGLALAASVKGYRCVFTVTDKQSQEKIDILRAVGAEVIVCPTNVEPQDPRSYYSVSKRLSQEIPNAWYPNQYDNLSNREAHYRTTGPEIWQQTEGRITHFVAGMGTTGTIVGASTYLKEQNPDVFTLGVDTYGSLFQKLHETGEIVQEEIYPYLTEGVGEDFVPQNLDNSVIDRILKVSDKDAAIMARKAARLEGLFIGWSCGSALQGALELARGLSKKDLLVVILPDHGSRYLAKIYNDVWMRDRGWLEGASLMTAAEIIHLTGSRGELVYVECTHTIAQAVLTMREKNISQLPVMEQGKVVGAVNEGLLMNALVDDPSHRDLPVTEVMNDPFPAVLGTTRMDVLSKMIGRENPALLVKMDDGHFEILTKQDLITALAN